MFENCPAKDNDNVKPNSIPNKNYKKGKFDQMQRILTSRAL